MHIPPEHYSLVGPLWSRFEEALEYAGARGSTAEEQINSLQSRLGGRRIGEMHYVRMQRNALQHRNPTALENPEKWESLCRQAIGELHPGSSAAEVATSNSSSNSSSNAFFGKLFVWGLAGYVVLHNERLMELLLTGGLCYFLYKLFRPSK